MRAPGEDETSETPPDSDPDVECMLLTFEQFMLDAELMQISRLLKYLCKHTFA